MSVNHGRLVKIGGALQTYTFGVPAAHRELLAHLAALPDSQFEALAGALRPDSAPAFHSHSEFTVSIKGAVPEWTETEASLLAVALTSMLSAAASHGVEQEQFATSVSQSNDLDLDDSQRITLADRILTLLTAPDVLLSGKAVDLATEYERRIHTVRIVTDVRPVGGTDPDSEPLGDVETHQLRIDAITGYDSQPYFFALDRSDLRRLKDCVDRAIEKSDSLTEWFKRMGFREVDLVGTEHSDLEGDQ